MNKTLYSRLKTYGTLAATVATGSASAGIVYTDVDPDTTLAGNNNASNDYFFIDLDQNGVDDFQIGMFNAQQTTSRTYSWNGVWATGINGSSMATASNAIAYSGVSFGFKMTLPLSAGSSIGASRSFSYYNLFGARSYWSTASGSTGGNGYFGNFAGQGEKYIGLRFFKGGNAHYGWARVQVDSAFYGVTLMDFAYESCPGVAIQAGASVGGSGVNVMSLAACDSAVIGGNAYYFSQTVYDTISTGTCDSVDVITLTVNNTASSIDLVEGCDSVVYNGMTYMSDTTWADTLVGASATGCDSIANVVIAVNYTASSIDLVEGCDSVAFNGVMYLSDTTWTDTLVGGSVSGCDSIANVTIAVSNSVEVNQSLTIFEGDSVLVGGAIQTTSGTYVDTLTTVGGCDSIVTTVLNVESVGSVSDTRANQVAVFPNPSNGMLHLRIDDAVAEERTVVITDLKGKTLQTLTMLAGSTTAGMDISHLPKGVYMLRVQGETTSSTVKLIRE